MKVLRKFKRVILFFEAFSLMFLSLFSAPTITRAENGQSNTYRSEMIKMAQSKKLADLDLNSITPEALRVIAYFLSNFYQPWATTLDLDDKNQKKTKDAMADALVKFLKYDKDVANAMVNAVYQKSLDTAKPLYIYWNWHKEDDKGGGDHFNYNSVESESVADWDILAFDVTNKQGGRSDPKYYMDAKGDSHDITEKDNYKDGHKPDDKVPEAFLDNNLADADIDEDTHISNGTNTGWGDIHALHNDGVALTPDLTKQLPQFYYRFSYGVMMNCFAKNRAFDVFWCDSPDDVSLEAARKSNVCYRTNDTALMGYMMTMEDMTCTDGHGGTEFMSESPKSINKLTIANAGKFATQEATLYIDWVGNIILDDTTHRQIILPAVMNPYSMNVLAGVDSEGKDGTLNVKDTLNLVNVWTYMILSNDTARINYQKEPQQSGKKKSKVEKYNLIEYTYPQQNTSNLFGTGVVCHKDGGFRKHRGTDKEDLDDIDGDDAKIWDKFIHISESKPDIADYIWLWGHSGNAKGDGSYAEGGGTWTRKRIDKVRDARFLKSYESDGYTGLGTSHGGCHPIDTIMDVNNFAQFEPEGSSEDNTFVYGSMFDLASNMGGYGSSVNFNSTSDFGAFMNKISGVGEGFWRQMYLTYLYAYEHEADDLSLANSGEFDATTHRVNAITNFKAFPQPGDDEHMWDNVEIDNSQMQEEIQSMIYYMLHPTEGIRYFAQWLKNKITGFFLGWHEDIVGASNSNSSTGATHYIGFTGYTTIPNLHDIEWTDWLLGMYNSIVVYLIILIAMIMVCYIVVGHQTFQKALLGVLIFAICAFIPPVGVNGMVDTINQSCDRIYGQKFLYWAIVQHQTHLDELYEAMQNSTSKDQFDKWVLKTQAGGSNGKDTTSGYMGVKIKWMSPKKDNMFAYAQKQVTKDAKDSNANASIAASEAQRLMNADSNLTGQEFTGNTGALYLYRDYLDVTTYSLQTYNLYDVYSGGGYLDPDDHQSEYGIRLAKNWATYGEGVHKIMTRAGERYTNILQGGNETSSSKFSGSKRMQAYLDVSSINAMRNGFLVNTLGDVSNKGVYYYGTNTLAVTYLLNFNSAYSNMYNCAEGLTDLIENNKKPFTDTKFNGYGIPQSNFNFTANRFSETENTNYKGKKVDVDHFIYSGYSESPFYFFTYNIIDQMKAKTQYSYSTEKEPGQANSSSNVTKLLLTNNLDYFYNMDENAGNGYGELRDFMNMHDLFYYVLPLMDYGNRVVYEFGDEYGIQQYDDVKVTFTEDGYVQVQDGDDIKVISDIIEHSKLLSDDKPANDTVKWTEASKDWTTEKKYKFWHNYNVAAIYNMYCAWADTLTDCTYAKSEVINVSGEKYTVEFPLDPTSYFKVDKNGNMTEGRPMVFSRSEQKYYGLQDYDLTGVEKKIIEVQDKVYKDAINLLNYGKMDDDVLVSAYAMLQTFAFNQIFSQSSITGESYILYPQNFELKLFSYDAYLRLILTNTTGDDLQQKNSSLYERIGNNTSIFFGILLIIVDVICVYVLPALKLFFLIVVFFLSIALIIASAISIEMNMVRTITKSIIVPLCGFAGISIGLAFIVSMFMSNGATGVTGDTIPTISLGDPTMVILVMIAINLVAVTLYYKLLKFCFKTFMKYAKTIGTSIIGTVAGAFGKLGTLMMAGRVSSKVGKLTRAIQGSAERSGNGSGGLGGSGSASKSGGRGSGSGSGFGGGSGLGSGSGDGSGAGSGSGDGATGALAAGAIGGAAGAAMASNMAKTKEDTKRDDKLAEKFESKVESGKEKRTGGESGGSKLTTTDENGKMSPKDSNWVSKTEMKGNNKVKEGTAAVAQAREKREANAQKRQTARENAQARARNRKSGVSNSLGARLGRGVGAVRDKVGNGVSHVSDAASYVKQGGAYAKTGVGDVQQRIGGVITNVHNSVVGGLARQRADFHNNFHAGNIERTTQMNFENNLARQVQNYMQSPSSGGASVVSTKKGGGKPRTRAERAAIKQRSREFMATQNGGNSLQRSRMRRATKPKYKNKHTR